uniref:Secreted frizzled-related protein 1 n=1 Tax=Castor canadensis TaxID=51338 RepID=A0A8B7VW98_CASCN|nr:secreted frizzled-related protein 1 [Castor canadensis]
MGSGRGAGGRRWAASSVLLALAAGLLGASSANEYDYVSFQSDIGSYQSGRFYTKPPQCVDIPVDLRLCHNVGYKKMVLPNLLEHETMAEVKQQASSWVPLLNKNCHIGTQVFLCSLFAPVCLDRPIYPCRWLCEAVRDSCEPVMQFFGFYWPEMLKCDKFPDGDVCIAMTPPNATEASKPQGTTVCPPCDNELKSEAIIEHLCASEFGKTVFLATSWGSGILAFPCPVSLVNREPGGKNISRKACSGMQLNQPGSSTRCGKPKVRWCSLQIQHGGQPACFS